MENASKALIIAAEMLIGIMILSLGVYLYVSFRQTAKENEQANAQQQLIQFNNNYTKYENQKDITIYDILTVVNQAKENNVKYDNDDQNDNYIIVNVINTGIAGGNKCQQNTDDKKEFLETLLEKDKNAIATQEPHKLPTYSCQITGYKNGRVHVIDFEKI